LGKKESESLFCSLINVLIVMDVSVARDAKEGDRNQNCRESGDQGEETCNEGMLGRGFRNSVEGDQESEHIRMRL